MQLFNRWNCWPFAPEYIKNLQHVSPRRRRNYSYNYRPSKILIRSCIRWVGNSLWSEVLWKRKGSFQVKKTATLKNDCINYLNSYKHVAKYIAIPYSYSILYIFTSGLKVGWMTQTIWVTWVTFLVGQVGLIRKINYLDVMWISRFLENSVGIFGCDECIEISLVWN